MMSELVRYDAMCRAIDAAYAVDEVKAIHDKAAMLQAAARVAKNVEAETRAYEIRMRAARKAGALSKKIEKAAGRPNNSPDRADNLPKASVLNSAGISTQQASEWERLSEVPSDQFEAALASKSVRSLIENDAAAGVFHKDALTLIGILRDFERHGLLTRTPQDFMRMMTASMLEEVYRLAPLAAAWLSTIKEYPNEFNGGRRSSDSAEERRASD